MPTTDFWEIIGWALACSVPVVVSGALLIRLARSWSLAVSMVVLVLIPTLATFTGVLGASGFMITETFERIAVVLVIVAVVIIPAAVLLARYQARRTVWEQEIRASERAAEQSRRRLVAFVSHDLRTPLAGAKAAVSSLRSDDVGFSPEDTAELLATIEESVDQLTALVGNLLDSSRLAAGVVHPDLRRVYLEEVVQRALLGIPRAATGLAEGEPDRVRVDVGDAVVLADPGLLERVLVNLVDNALRHAGGLVVRVNAGPVGDRVLINVVDEGPGVPRDTGERMFEPFQRLGDQDNTSGVGLGLSVARGFVEAMGGTVTATDTPGGGLTMVVELASAQ